MCGVRRSTPRFKRAYSNASDRRTKGQSYAADVYDQAIPQVLAAISVGARTKVDVVAEIDRGRIVDVDAFAPARIERDRHQATNRYLRDRDMRALEATINRLDREDQEARVRPSAVVTNTDARDYLGSLPKLWENTDDEGRRRMALALFERIDVLGLTMIATPTLDAEARGLVAALDAPVRCSIGGYGRGERC